MESLFWASGLLIIFSFIGYPITLKIINKLVKKDSVFIDEYYRPMVTIIIPAHNEEAVIEKKLENLINLDYPNNKLEIIIASDNSTDKTNNIVKSFISKVETINVRLYEVKQRKGKTNAQNETVKVAKGEVIVFSDANSMLKKDSVIELVKYFKDNSIAYVSGKLVYTNKETADASRTEDSYWNYDLIMREYESNISSITAGNGALYAVRKSDYIDLEPIYCHDSMMPIKYAISRKKAKYSNTAIAFEKAGETSDDEFKRKVRMARKNLSICYSDLQKYNPFRCGWFSYFYFSHRYLRNSLWMLHVLVFVSNAFIIEQNIIYLVSFIGQCFIYTMAMLGIKFKGKIFYIPYYYCMTIIAQFKGALNEITGKSKPFWEKAESTR